MALTGSPQLRAIVWAQWRSLLNRSPLTRGSFTITALVMAAWYGLWTLGAISAGVLCATREGAGEVLAVLLPVLFAASAYWQLMPVFLASSGASLDLRRLIVYPIRRSELFEIEVALRVTAAIEMLIVVAGTAAGVAFNPSLPAWGIASFVPFILFNLLLSSAVRDLLTRFLARKRFREIGVLVVVLLAALPQLLLRSSEQIPELSHLGTALTAFPWPWVAAAEFAVGRNLLVSAAALAVWTASAWWLARRQFDASLREDAVESRGGDTAKHRALAEALYRLPGLLWKDPLAAIVEKEIRSLSRSPRFRLVFIMGFTFGLIIWLPIGFRRDQPNWITEHYLTVGIGYQVLLLGEVAIWNVFGFDRKAAQLWFSVPVRLTTVLAAKNLTAVFFTSVNAVLIILICAAFGFRITLASLAEALSVTAVLSLLLIGIGNMLSVRTPRPVNPDQSWGRSSAGRVQLTLLLLYPLIAVPIALAFLARHAFGSELAFYGVLAFDAVLAGIVYWIATESALNTAEERREAILDTLSRDAGVLSS